MSQIITLEVSDAMFAAVQVMAEARGQPVHAWMLNLLHENLPLPGPLPYPAAPAEDTELSCTPEQHAEWAALEAAIEAELAEWAALEARIAAERRNPPSLEEAHARNEQIFQRWFPNTLSEEEILELAMSEELSEWNLDL